MKYIKDVDLKGKRVILRCDFNVPMRNGKIKDDLRIVKSLKTINYLLEQNCSIVLMSHLGRVSVRADKIKLTLEPVAKRLSELLNKEVKFLDSPVGMNTLVTCRNMNPGDVVLLENTRHCDYPEKLESNNDEFLSKYWSSLGEVFVVDAFATLHRPHASVAGISRYLPTYFGFLVEEEIKGLSPVTQNVKHPFGIFMGGAKVEDKLKYIKDLLPKCDYLLVGGGIANSFLYACGYDVEDSLCTSDELTLDELRGLFKNNKQKLVMPIDFIMDDGRILDLDNKSITKYTEVLQKCKTIFLNGTCGVFEEQRYAKGTINLFTNIIKMDTIKIAGGGDTLNAIDKFELTKGFDFLSSGGGASLEYVSSGHLKGLDYIEKMQKEYFSSK